MVCAPVQLIIPSLKLGDYLSVPGLEKLTNANRSVSTVNDRRSPYRCTNHALSFTYLCVCHESL